MACTVSTGSSVYDPPMEKRPETLIAKNVRRLRDTLGWTQEELAERAGLSSVKMIETGKRGGRVDTLQKLAEAMHCRIADLFEDEDEKLTPGLAEFLASPMAKSVSAAEARYLRSIHLPGREMTAESYYNALQMIRSSAAVDRDADDDQVQ